MKNKKSEMSEKNVIIFLLFYVIFISSAIIIRDLRLDAVLISKYMSEFDQPILCNQFPQCFRVTTNFIGISGNYAGNFFNLFLSNQNYGYVQNRDIEKIFKDGFSILLRLILIWPIMYYIFKISKKTHTSSFLIALGFFLVISGYPLSLINNYFSVYLINYDYASIFLTGIYFNFFQRINQGAIKYIFFLILASLTFENLPLVFIVSAIIVHLHTGKLNNNLRFYVLQALGLLVSILTPLMLILIAQYKFGDAIFVETQYYFLGNLGNILKLLIALALLFFWPFLIGLFLSIWKSRVFDLRSKKRGGDTLILKSVLCGLFVTYLIGFFTSGLSSEGSRQTMSAQLLLIALGYLQKKGIKFR